MWCRSGNWLSARKADLASTAERNAISVQDQLEN
jgi:hypothetical protein